MIWGFLPNITVTRHASTPAALVKTSCDIDIGTLDACVSARYLHQFDISIARQHIHRAIDYWRHARVCYCGSPSH